MILTNEEFHMALEWISECEWPDLLPEDVADLTPEEVERALERHFAGGINEFKRTCTL